MLRSRSLAPHPPIAEDERVRRAVVVQLRVILGLELRNNPFGQNLAELDAPLVE
jgi:hypothetical protein